MAQQTINNGESGAVVRGKINDNFTGLYQSPTITGLVTIGNGGTSPITPQGLLSVKESNAGSGAVLNGMFYCEQTAATTGSVQGVEGYVETSNPGASVVTLAIGVVGNVEHSGAGVLDFGRAVQGGGILSGAGGLADMMSFFSTFSITGSGTVDRFYGIYLETADAGGGTITTRYGIYQEDPNAINYFGGGVRMDNLPTSAAGLSAGDLWDNSGVVNIV